MIDSCLEQQAEAFKPGFMKFWVGLSELGLGFTRVRRENGEEEERRKRMRVKKWKESGQKPFI